LDAQPAPSFPMWSGRCRRSASVSAVRCEVVALGEDEPSLHPAQMIAPVAMAKMHGSRRKDGITTDEDTPVRRGEFRRRHCPFRLRAGTLAEGRRRARVGVV
jgi:hypothetical protein